MKNNQNIIVKHLAGSHAYGTNIETSDTDYRGIFMAEKKFIITPFFNIKEISDSSEEDTKYYELNNYMSLYLDGNPNILETLWVDQSDIIFSTPEYDLLRQYNQDLLSARVAFTYTGYAHDQKTRMKNHYSWMDKERSGIKQLSELIKTYPYNIMKEWIYDTFPEYISAKLDFSVCNKTETHKIDFDKFMRNQSLQMISTKPLQHHNFIKLVHNYFEHKVTDSDFNILNYNNGYELLPYGENIYAVLPKDGSKCINADGSIHKINTSNLSIEEIKKTPCMIVKFNSDEYDKSSNNRSSYHSWKKNRNIVRGELEEIHGYDSKFAMHTIRLLIQAEEILTQNELIVKRKDADMLLDIRAGKWTYEEVISVFEEKEQYIRSELFNSTSLPKTADRELAAKVLIQLRELQWYK